MSNEAETAATQTFWGTIISVGLFAGAVIILVL